MRLIRYTYPNYRSLAPSYSGLGRSPWSGLETEMDRLFETALRDFGGVVNNDQFPVDLFEDADHAYVRAELPGLSRDDINVEMAEGNLTISGKRKSEGPEGEETFSFSRSVRLPDEVDSGKVSASYEHGVLTVTLPKREEAKPKKITVSVK
ncbi:Hsp20/alpha crystallin family protein [Opitutus sp. ER46]|uniref:Hsp20/alpha crystallin family protein n=1 Tax=Opitutus sp. ER46 TaxID=2161864 RepID=UPI000D2FDED2|nr:Hsp20/alpha crystallin family protein [Opitutus sp. ER46]PTX91818.1 heat-shock protein Hsp20 [Opitutus sp. ER46]